MIDKENNERHPRPWRVEPPGGRRDVASIVDADGDPIAWATVNEEVEYEPGVADLIVAAVNARVPDPTGDG